MLQRLPVDSSSLASIGYSAAERVLEVEFRHGAVYRYLKVAPETYEAPAGRRLERPLFQRRHPRAPPLPAGLTPIAAVPGETICTLGQSHLHW